MAAVAKPLEASLVVAAGYFAYPAGAVACDLRDLPGGPSLVKQPYDLKMRALHRVLCLPIAAFQLLCACMRRQL